MFEAIVWNGKNSYLDFGLTIAEPPEIGNPELNEIRDSVPHMNGDYDFTYINGKPTYKRRKVGIIFNIIGECFDDMWKKRCDAVMWLMSAHGSTLSFDRFMRGWYFEDVSPVISEDLTLIGKRAAQLEVTFYCAPYITNGKQNVTLIPACPAFKGNTFGYIQKSGGYLKITTTDSICADIQFSASTVGSVILQEYTVTEDTPAEFAVTAYLSPNAAGQMQIADTDGNTAELAPEAVSEYGGKLAVYRYSSEKYPNTSAIRFTADVTDFRSISAMIFDETAITHSAPVRCRRGDTDISFRINNSGEITETKLSEGGNIIMISGTAPAEVYAACRKEVL